jgi:TldD protein
MPGLDPGFTALPYRALGDAALQRARELGAGHADFRFERVRRQEVRVRDEALQGTADDQDLGFAVRVIHGGAWGFASGVHLTVDEAVRVAQTAVEVARVSAALTSAPVEIADEPVYDDVSWVSSYLQDPFEVSVPDKAAVLLDWTRRLRRHRVVEHATAEVLAVHENKYYADLAGTRTTQQRVRLLPTFTAMGSDDARGIFDDMTSIAPPAGRGWEYVVGPPGGGSGTGAWDWDAELAEVPDLLAEKLAAPTVAAGLHDLVIHPSNLWLTIHESVGHATELDRALGYEANYAGTSFATIDKLDTLQYGSPAMNITGDRTVEHGLATIGYDDEGVATQSWDIIRDGMLVGYQLDRSMAHLHPELNRHDGKGRSNGCAYADSPGHIPIQRMANVSLRPATEEISTDDLIGRVERGLYVVGDKSWSIDMQRFNFQFTGQRFYAIRDGELVGQVRDAAYQATTTEFWGSMEAVGGPATWVLGGAFNCGKAQPGQVASVSHGCPSALFRGVRILNTDDEGAH